MKKSNYDRRAFLDHLEKKYIKKVQLHAFKRESERLKHQLLAIRGKNVTRRDELDADLFELPDYRLRYS